MSDFEHTFVLAERYGHNDVTMRKFDGKKYVLFNDALTKKEAVEAAKELKGMNFLTRVVHTVEGYRVYYHRRK